MIIPNSVEELATYVEKGRKCFFTADCAGTVLLLNQPCQKLEATHPEYTFIEVDRDVYIDAAIEWGIMGIPKFCRD